MSSTDLTRVKEDLAAIRSAAGLEPPFGQEDVRASFMLAAGGAAAMLWALLPLGLPDQWGMIPVILLVIAYVARMRFLVA